MSGGSGGSISRSVFAGGSPGGTGQSCGSTGVAGMAQPVLGRCYGVGSAQLGQGVPEQEELPRCRISLEVEEPPPASARLQGATETVAGAGLSSRAVSGAVSVSGRALQGLGAAGELWAWARDGDA